MDDWAAANMKLRSDRDAMNEVKRRESVARKQEQQGAAAAAMLEDPRGAELCGFQHKVAGWRFVMAPDGDLYIVTMH